MLFSCMSRSRHDSVLIIGNDADNLLCNCDGCVHSNDGLEEKVGYVLPCFLHVLSSLIRCLREALDELKRERI